MGTFTVDLGGLIGVFGGHLYSSSDVFVRELLQNAFDALAVQRRSAPDFIGEVVVRLDPAGARITISDDGVGLDRQGIETLLNVIASSSKRHADGSRVEDQLGRFGIGLLSAFLVTDELHVRTRMRGGEGLSWQGSSSGIWTIREDDAATVGTTVTMVLRPSHRTFADPLLLEECVARYGSYMGPGVLRYEVAGGSSRVVSETPPWRLTTDPARHDWLERKGLVAVALVPIESTRASGMLWIRDEATTFGDGRCDLYLGGVLLRKSATDVLPPWASFVSGVLDLRGVTPTASREDAVRDSEWMQLQQILSEQLIEWLKKFALELPDAFAGFVRRHAVSLLRACIESSALMAAIGDRIPFPTNVGTIPLARVRAHDPKTLHVVYERQQFAVAAPVASARGIVLVVADFIHARDFVNRFCKVYGCALKPVGDQALSELIRSADDVQERFAHVIVAAEKALAGLGLSVVLGAFAPAEIPALLLGAGGVRERATQLLTRSVSPLVGSALRGLRAFASEPVPELVLNADNSLVAALERTRDPALIGAVVGLLHAQAAVTLHGSLTLEETARFTRDLGSILAGRLGADQRLS